MHVFFSLYQLKTILLLNVNHPWFYCKCFYKPNTAFFQVIWMHIERQPWSGLHPMSSSQLIIGTSSKFHWRQVLNIFFLRHDSSSIDRKQWSMLLDNKTNEHYVFQTPHSYNSLWLKTIPILECEPCQCVISSSKSIKIPTAFLNFMLYNDMAQYSQLLRSAELGKLQRHFGLSCSEGTPA